MVTGPVNEPVPLIVLYDGGCPLCRREIGTFGNLKPNTPVCFADVSDTALPLPPGTPREQLLGGVQTADQVATVTVWLLGDGSARLTGQVLAVDGGFTTVRPLV